MKTLAVLLSKDLRRAWRNPAGWIVFLAIPLVITGLIGLIFGPKSQTNALGRIRFALVDEDDSPLTRFLRGALTQREGSTNFDAVFLGRSEAWRQVQDNQLSALLVIPAGFTKNYLTTTNVVTFELVKNPAESIRPAVLEELLGALVTGLDAVKRHLGPELPEWQALFEGEGDYHRVAELIVRAGDKLQAARKILSPLRVSYTRVNAADLQEAAVAPATNHAALTNTGTSTATAAPPGPGAAPAQGAPGKKPAAPKFNVFAYLLPGMATMFLLFLGENASRDVQREIQQRTLQRFRTLHDKLFGFVASKALFCLVFLLLASAVMLGGGALLFGIHWKHPFAMAVLTAAYCLFASGLMTLLPALLGDQRASQVLANVSASLLGLAGGSAFPASQLPAVLRDHVCPWLPNYWYTEIVRSLNFDTDPANWLGVAAKTALVGLILMAFAAVRLRRTLERGARG